MTPKGAKKKRGGAAGSKGGRTTYSAASGSTRTGVEQQSAQEQEQREEREEQPARARVFKTRMQREAEEEKKDEAYTGQPSEYPPPPTTGTYGGAYGGYSHPGAFPAFPVGPCAPNPWSHFLPGGSWSQFAQGGGQFGGGWNPAMGPSSTWASQGSVPSAGSQPQQSSQQAITVAHRPEGSCPRSSQDPSHRAAAPQQYPGQDATSLQQPHPQPAASQSQPAAWAQSQAVASSDSPPSQSLPPFEPFPDSDDDFKMNNHSPLSFIDSTNHTTAGSTFNGLKIIPNIAPPQMFPSLTAIGTTAISMKANGSCLFHALADQICHDPNQADEVREAIVNFIADNRDVFKAMLPLNDIHDS
jgi:hypothetical protein